MPDKPPFMDWRWLIFILVATMIEVPFYPEEHTTICACIFGCANAIAGVFFCAWLDERKRRQLRQKNDESS